MNKEKVLRTAEVAELTGFAVSTVQAKSNPKSSAFDKKFPRAFRMGKRALVFSEAEVLAWIDSQRMTSSGPNDSGNLQEIWARSLPLIGVLIIGDCSVIPPFSAGRFSRNYAASLTVAGGIPPTAVFGLSLL